MKPLFIREVKFEDVEKFINLLFSVYLKKYDVIFKSKINDGKAILIKEMKSRNNLEGNFVAVENELIVGAVILKTKEMKQNIFQSLKLFLTELGFYYGLRAFIVGGYHHSFSERFIKKDACFIENLFILEKYRRKGIGKELMKRAEQFARENNKKVMYGFFEISNISAKSLDLKSGFKAINVKNSILTKIFFGNSSWVYVKREL